MVVMDAAPRLLWRCVVKFSLMPPPNALYAAVAAVLSVGTTQVLTRSLSPSGRAGVVAQNMSHFDQSKLVHFVDCGLCD